jgi:acyl-CoA thioesterase I
MRRFALYFASGDSLDAGVALLLIVVVISSFLKQPVLRLIRSVGIWAGIAMIVMASTPFSWITDLIFFAVFVGWLIADSRPAKRSVRWTLAALFVLVLIAGCLAEAPYRTLPHITGASSDHVVVIGDSISSGIDPRQNSWPTVMGQATGVPVINMAQPGAGTKDAVQMAGNLRADDRVVLIEIGGNDLLGGVSSDDFCRALDVLLRRIATPGRTIVMFELPLIPSKIAYGQIQRRLAKRYGVWLIPKRYFADVIAGADATSDGLHLSDVGAHRMAALVTRALAPVLEFPAAHR